MSENPFPFDGLSDQEVEAARLRYGINALKRKGSGTFWPALKDTVTEPMFLLLATACTIYFILREFAEGFFMLVAIVLVSAISFYQDSRSRKALAALRAYTQPLATVLRNKKAVKIPTEEIVVGDLVVAEEGTLIPADGEIVQSNDFSVNESILTGEAFSVFKSIDPENKQVYQGTLVVSGLALFNVTQVGEETRFGKIGKSLDTIESEKTPLQIQIGDFVKKMAIGGMTVFLIVWGLNFFQSRNILDSLLKGLTLAMSILPEEIPVAFTTFMALGAWRLMREGVIVKGAKTIETLGSATVICTDKTGTITENKMALAELYIHKTKSTLSREQITGHDALTLVTTAMWASEPVPFDPMEKVLHELYGQLTPKDERATYSMVHEYPLSGKPPMMTHVFENVSHHRIIACKGAVESIVRHSTLSETEKQTVLQQADEFARKGFRVLGVSQAFHDQSEFPDEQQHFTFEFLGLVAFLDPPKPNIRSVFDQFNRAGLDVKIITGDNALTTLAIARQAGLTTQTTTLNGEDLIKMDNETLGKTVASTTLFTRMFPEAKVRIIEALKKQQHIVAMTGDGVNDGPALKAAHIGIAMGKRGSEIAKQASALILTDDDLAKMITAIAMGRKIYSNLKKAIQYIISIHIPIILTVAIPLILGWIYPNIFTPVHIIFLELIMGPTCSIVYENEPLEEKSMEQPPRKTTDTFLTWRELSISILQGLVITAGVLAVYQYAVSSGLNEDTTRTMVFTTLIAANIFLTLVNRSFYFSILKVILYKNWMLPTVISITVLLTGLMLYVPAFKSFFHLSTLSSYQVGLVTATGFCSVIWFEGYKWWKRKYNKTH